MATSTTSLLPPTAAMEEATERNQENQPGQRNRVLRRQAVSGFPQPVFKILFIGDQCTGENVPLSAIRLRRVLGASPVHHWHGVRLAHHRLDNQHHDPAPPVGYLWPGPLLHADTALLSARRRCIRRVRRLAAGDVPQRRDVEGRARRQGETAVRSADTVCPARQQVRLAREVRLR